MSKRSKKDIKKQGVVSTGSPNRVNSKAEIEDLELDGLLIEVDRMLTEMTQSKWLSSEWPNLEIDMGNKKAGSK